MSVIEHVLDNLIGRDVLNRQDEFFDYVSYLLTFSNKANIVDQRCLIGGRRRWISPPRPKLEELHDLVFCLLVKVTLQLDLKIYWWWANLLLVGILIHKLHSENQVVAIVIFADSRTCFIVINLSYSAEDIFV